MPKTNRNYSSRTLKILFALSGNQCAHPDCSNPIIEPATAYSDAHVSAQICHIAPAGKKGPRAEVSRGVKNRNEAENLLLLCPTHHGIIDGQHETYPPELLRQWKQQHEAKLAELGGQSFATLQLGVSAQSTDVNGEIARLELELRKTRFYTDGKTAERAKSLGLRLIRGDLSTGAAKVRASALGWCARTLALTEERRFAEEAVLVAESLVPVESVEIARSFLLLAQGDKDAALERVGRVQGKIGRSAQFLVAVHETQPAEAVAWFNSAGLKVSDLDSDGKFVYFTRCLLAEVWDEFERLCDWLSDDDFELTPALLHQAALANLLPSVPVDLRRMIALQPPFDAANFPLSSDAAALEQRRKSKAFFERSAEVAAGFGSRNAPSASTIYATWIALRDPQTFEIARAQLAEHLRDPQRGLWAVSLALQFGLKVDAEAVEREILRRVSLSRYNDIDAAIARFALVFSQPSPAAAAAYLDRYRLELLELIDPVAVTSIEIELLAKAGQNEAATARLEAAAADGLPLDQQKRLRELVGDVTGSPDFQAAEEEFLAQQTTPSLVKLIEIFEREPATPKFLHYTKLLLSRTRALADAERVGQALASLRGYPELERFLAEEGDFLSQSTSLRGVHAWLLYGQGKLIEAAAELAIVRQSRNDINDRLLAINIALTSGAWDEIAAILEEEWRDRAQRTPQQLLWRANLAGLIGVPRQRDFLFLAAENAPEDASILASAYFMATEFGIEVDDTVAGWLQRAAALSGEDGPIKQMSLADIADMKPGWDRHEQDTWEKVRTGELPMFLAAQLLRRSLLDVQLRPMTQNRRSLDPRRRAWIPLYAGNRSVRDETPKCVSLDSTALLTLAFLDVVPQALAVFEKVIVPHSTLTWLAQERKRAVFHQPSRVVAAHRLRDFVSRGKLSPFIADRSAIPALIDEVGNDLADMLQIARATSSVSDRQRLVVRSLPVHRIGSLGEENADLEEYRDRICSCLAVVNKLAERGQISRVERQRAGAYLQLQEQRREDEPTIEDGAELLLDDLSVSYFDHLGLLGRIADCGFTVRVTQSEIDQADSLITYEQVASEVLAAIDTLQQSLASGIASGAVAVAALDHWKVNDEDNDLWQNPTFNAMALADHVEAIVIDDRALNRHSWIDGEQSRAMMWSSLDVLHLMRRQGSLSEDQWLDRLTQLRRGGALFTPIVDGELQLLLRSASLKDGLLVEAAELRAIRENILCARLSDWLQISSEAAWLDGLFGGIICAIHFCWRELDEPVAYAASSWLFQFLDARNWAGRFQLPTASEIARFGHALFVPQLVLRLVAEIPITMEHLQRFHAWLEAEVLTPLQAEEPEAFFWLVDRVRQTLNQACGDPVAPQ